MRGERMRVVGVDQVRVGRPQRPLARVPLWGPGERVFGDGGGVGHPGIAGVAGVRDDGDAESVAPAVVEAGQPLSRAGLSRLSPGAARRSEWAGLAVDVLLDDGQGCASAGDGEIGRRPQVAAHAGADTRAGEFAPYRVGGAALEAMGENG